MRINQDILGNIDSVAGIQSSFPASLDKFRKKPVHGLVDPGSMSDLFDATWRMEAWVVDRRIRKLGDSATLHSSSTIVTVTTDTTSVSVSPVLGGPITTVDAGPGAVWSTLAGQPYATSDRGRYGNPYLDQNKVAYEWVELDNKTTGKDTTSITEAINLYVAPIPGVSPKVGISLSPTQIGKVFTLKFNASSDKAIKPATTSPLSGAADIVWYKSDNSEISRNTTIFNTTGFFPLLPNVWTEVSLQSIVPTGATQFNILIRIPPTTGDSKELLANPQHFANANGLRVTNIRLSSKNLIPINDSSSVQLPFPDADLFGGTPAKNGNVVLIQVSPVDTSDGSHSSSIRTEVAVVWPPTDSSPTLYLGDIRDGKYIVNLTIIGT